MAGIARMAKKNQVPAIAVVDENIESLYDNGLSGIFSINRGAKDFQITKKNSKVDLILTIESISYL
ncbi:hypothetical protein [Paenibacillus sp. N3.4]|uniref:hypothetical protein n=1 Tax=Paenibacillus sp. N3.4 TaxID=2603222 RepID=UPI0028FC8C69|nr:hypothetical protein [Paenibacillus sp. N3.4]